MLAPHLVNLGDVRPGAGDSPRASASTSQLYPHAEEDGVASSNGDANPADDSVFLPKKQLHIEVPETRSSLDDKSGLSPGSSAKHARSHAEFSSSKGELGRCPAQQASQLYSARFTCAQQ